MAVVAYNSYLVSRLGFSQKHLINKTLPELFYGKSSIEEIKKQKDKNIKVKLSLATDKAVDIQFSISPVLLGPSETGQLLIGSIVDERREWDKSLNQILKGTYNAVGNDYLHSVTQSLAQSLGMKYAFIGELTGKGSGNPKVTTVAYWNKNRHKTNFTFDLKGSPYEKIMARKQLIVSEEADNLYPNDESIIKPGIKAFISTPILSKKNTPIGLVVVMDTKPINISKEDSDKLTLFASRISTEMEWVKNDTILMDQEEKLRAIIQSLPDPIYCQSNDGIYETCNQAFLDYFDLENKDILNKPYSDLPKSIKNNKILSATEKLEKSHGITRIEASLKTPTSKKGDAIVIRSPILDKKGNQTGIVGVIQDISEMKEAEKVLKLNEQKYRTLFNKANDAFLLMRNDIFVDCNPKALKTFGCSRDKLVGKSPYLFSPLKQADQQDSKTKALKKIQAAISGKPQKFYWKHKKYNGQLFDAEVSLNAFYIKSELYIQAIVRDVTDKVEANKDIEKQTSRMEKMYELMSDTSTPFKVQVSDILQLATQSLGMQIGTLSLVNKEDYIVDDFFSSISDFSADDIHYLWQTYCSITISENKIVAIPNVKNSKYVNNKAGEFIQLESYIGVPYWVKGKLRGTLAFASFYPVKEFKSSDTDFVQIIAQWIGATVEREEYEDSLRKNEALLDTLLREIPVDFSVRDPSLKMLWQSNKSKEIWGNNVGKPIDYSDVNKVQAAKWKGIFDLVLKGETVRGENSVKIYDKPYLFYSIASPIKVNGKVEQITIIHIDISQIKKAEKALKSQNTKLKKLNAELDRFVYSASHDLRAPLASLLGLIDLSKREPLSPTLEEYLRLMDRSINKLDSFISDITDYSRNLRLKTSLDKIDFKGLVNDLYNSLVFMTSDKIDFSINVKGKHDFYTDIDRLKLILSNLIANSIRYRSSRRNLILSVSVAKGKKKAVIQVKDNGLGIQEEYQKKVFDMFFRANDKNTGSGLGLFIVKETIDKLKGNINLVSEVGKGSTFTLEIPNPKN